MVNPRDEPLTQQRRDDLRSGASLHDRGQDSTVLVVLGDEQPAAPIGDDDDIAPTVESQSLGCGSRDGPDRARDDGCIAHRTGRGGGGVPHSIRDLPRVEQAAVVQHPDLPPEMLDQVNP